jgi:hypothetical protein
MPPSLPASLLLPLLLPLLLALPLLLPLLLAVPLLLPLLPPLLLLVVSVEASFSPAVFPLPLPHASAKPIAVTANTRMRRAFIASLPLEFTTQPACLQGNPRRYMAPPW